MSFKAASSLIILALKEKPFKSLYNYKVLMLKRSGTSSFMPSSHVFPGGKIEPADSSTKWVEWIKKVHPEYLEKSLICNENRPSVLQGKIGEMDKDLSMRVTVLRETFEETGILLCRPKGIKSGSIWGQVFNSPLLTSWRTSVQKNPESFLDMCQELDCIPDVWALKLVGNWLTPGGYKKRFDTAFYTVCLPELKEAAADLTEIQQLDWYSPERLLRLNQAQQIWLPPPQVYEISRLMRFYMLEDLAEFAADREPKGCECFSSVRFCTSEGLIFPLPGDELYTASADDNRFAALPFSQTRCDKMHRLEIYSNGLCRVVVNNVKPRHGHILPVITENPSTQCCKINKK